MAARRNRRGSTRRRPARPRRDDAHRGSGRRRTERGSSRGRRAPRHQARQPAARRRGQRVPVRLRDRPRAVAARRRRGRAPLRRVAGLCESRADDRSGDHAPFRHLLPRGADLRAADRTAPVPNADSHVAHRREARPPCTRTLVAAPRSAQRARPGVAASHDARARGTVRLGCRARRRPARRGSDGRPHGDDGRDRARTARPGRGPRRPRHDGRARDRGDEPVQGSPLVRRSRRRRLLRSRSTRRPARVRAARLSVPRGRGPVGQREVERRARRTASGLARRSASPDRADGS